MRIIWWALCEGIICCALSHKFAKCNFEAQSIHETPSPISAEAASWCICAQGNPANYLYAAHIACSMVHIAYCTLLHLHAVRSIWWMQTMHNIAQFGYFAIYSIVPCEIALCPIIYQTLYTTLLLTKKSTKWYLLIRVLLILSMQLRHVFGKFMELNVRKK